MRVLVPSEDGVLWSVVSRSGTQGDIDDVTVVADYGPQRAPLTIRTVARLGTVLERDRFAIGRADTWEDMAALAINSLALSALPERLDKDSVRTAVTTADIEARELATDRQGWSETALPVGATTYALWAREMPEGFAAHADLGWAKVAMWGGGHAPEGAFALQNIDLGSDRYTDGSPAA